MDGRKWLVRSLTFPSLFSFKPWGKKKQTPTDPRFKAIIHTHHLHACLCSALNHKCFLPPRITFDYLVPSSGGVLRTYTNFSTRAYLIYRGHWMWMFDGHSLALLPVPLCRFFPLEGATLATMFPCPDELYPLNWEPSSVPPFPTYHSHEKTSCCCTMFTNVSTLSLWPLSALSGDHKCMPQGLHCWHQKFHLCTCWWPPYNRAAFLSGESHCCLGVLFLGCWNVGQLAKSLMLWH